MPTRWCSTTTRWAVFSLNATAGASMMRTQSSNVDLWAEGTKFSMTDGKPNGNVMYPNIFNPANYYANMAKQGLTRKRLNAVFATATFGYKDGLFLDATRAQRLVLDAGLHRQLFVPLSFGRRQPVARPLRGHGQQHRPVQVPRILFDRG